MQGLATKNAPSWSLPARYFVGAMAFWIALLALLLVHPGILTGNFLLAPKMLAIVHLTTLGWLTMTMQGALYQLIPVVLQVRFHSEKRGKLSFSFYTAGTVLMAYGFWTGQSGALAAGGTLVAAVLLLFVENALRTLWQARPLDVHGKFLFVAVLSLAAVSLLGVSLVAAMIGIGLSGTGLLTHLGMHVAVGVGGWLAFTLVGVAYKLVPMFTLVHDAPGRTAVHVFNIMSVGLAGILAAMGSGVAGLLTLVFLCVYLAGLSLFLWDITRIYQRRLRRRPDLGLQASMAATALLALTVLMAVALAVLELWIWQDGSWMLSRMLGAIGVLLLWGGFSGFVWSQLYKIVPFLVWLHRYGKLVGQQPVPLMQDLVRPETDRWWLTGHYAGVLVIAAGVLLGHTPTAWAGVFLMATAGAGLTARMLSVILGKGGVDRAGNTEQRQAVRGAAPSHGSGTGL